jgi:DNA helicase-2/ATP-dependent DNA helicase PcrA
MLENSDEMIALLNQLNEPQRQAVENTAGPVMIIAGAGSGKTRVLTYRIAYLLAQGVDSFNILSLTFTNKAAGEMRQRIEKLVGKEARNLWMGTFHSVFAKILRIEAQAIGFPANFTIYDTDDSRSLIKSILKELNLDDKTYKPSAVHNRISMAKNRLVSWQQYTTNPIFQEDDALSGRPQIGKIYQIYQDRLKKAGSMDFDDLLFNTNILFRDHPDILIKYQMKFQYIMVDEYQDTNLSQYLITKRLAEMYQNICVVGDDAQSIYAFRGADIQNILNFEKDYPSLRVFRLEQNYRSTKTIVEAANSVIKNNRHQLEKNVWTSNEDGDLIELIKAHSDTEEGKLVATQIFEEKMKEGWGSGEFAILYRTNSQSRSMEEALRRMNIKYKIVGGTSFYQRKEVKDMLAYLRFTLNTKDEESFKRIINLPKRGIGDSSVQKIVLTAVEQGVEIWDVLEQAHLILPGRASRPILDFVTLIKTFQHAAQQMHAFDFAAKVAKESGLLRELYEDKTPEGVSRYDNVQELLNGIQEFSENPENEDISVGKFLQDVSLMTDADDKRKQDKDCVTLMTIHGAKGLEFKSVFIVGLEEDLFPGQVDDRSDLEEERRLFYVAITRAEKRLRISYATSRYRFGTLRNCEPSRFLEEINTKYLKVTHKFIVEEKPASAGGSFMNQFQTKQTPVRKTVTPVSNHITSDNFIPTPPKNLSAGDRVEHAKFGFGTIIEMQENGAGDIRATVNYDSQGQKVMMLSFAKLMKVQ